MNHLTTKQDPLFLLIKAMTKQEKRHFKINVSKYKGSKDYLRLFDAIDAQKQYDEKAIKKKFKNEAYFSQISSVKTYLYRQIIKTLRNFYDDATCNITLNNFLTEIEFLYKKELFKNCLRTISKAKAHAEKYEKLPDLLKIIDWETRIAERTNNLEQVDLLRHKAAIKSMEIADQYDEITELRRIYLESSSLMRVLGEARSEEEISKHEEISRHPLVEKESSSFSGELLRLAIKAHKAQFQRGFNNITREMNSVLDLYDSNPHQIDEYINSYFGVLLELAINFFVAKKYIAADRMMQKMRVLQRKNEQGIAVTGKLKFLGVEAYSFIDQGEFAKALEHIPTITKLIEISHKELSVVEELMLYHSCFDIYFKNKDFKNAQRYVQKIINYEGENRLDLQSSARIVNLILQYEQKEYDQMGYALRSAYRYLMKKQRLYKAEAVILDFIRKGLRITSEKQILSALAELKEQLLPYKGESFITNFFLMEWIESKLQKRNLAEIMKENYSTAIAKEQAEVKMEVEREAR